MLSARAMTKRVRPRPGPAWLAFLPSDAWGDVPCGPSSPGRALRGRQAAAGPGWPRGPRARTGSILAAASSRRNRWRAVCEHLCWVRRHPREADSGYLSLFLSKSFFPLCLCLRKLGDSSRLLRGETGADLNEAPVGRHRLGYVRAKPTTSGAVLRGKGVLDDRAETSRVNAK